MMRVALAYLAAVALAFALGAAAAACTAPPSIFDDMPSPVREFAR